jgi:hypothetical protein
VKQIDRLETINEENPTLLVMTPDIKYYLLTAGGMTEPHGEWTDAARRNFEQALVDFAEVRDTDVVMMTNEMAGGETEIAYQKLYSAVGMTILTHHYGMFKLPSKEGTFDWSLGPGVKDLAEHYDADYALFTYYRDYQASGGRVAFAMLAAVAGASVSVGNESGFAALVDLKSGNVVWFNRVVAGAGELRESNGAHTAVRQLFAELPGN